MEDISPQFHVPSMEQEVTLPTSFQDQMAQTTTGFSQTPVQLNQSVTPPIQTYTPSAAGTATLDLSLGNDHRITMPAGNATIALSNVTVGQRFLVSVTQDSTGSRTVTWFSTIRWVDAGTPTLTTTANKRDTFGFICTGTGTYDGFVVGKNI